jgi:hypothetical protein
VLCVAEDAQTLQALRRAAVSAEWEVRAAWGEAEAIGEIDVAPPHVLVVFGPFERLVGLARDRLPWLPIVASFHDVRELVAGAMRTSGPVGPAALRRTTTRPTHDGGPSGSTP